MHSGVKGASENFSSPNDRGEVMGPRQRRSFVADGLMSSRSLPGGYDALEERSLA